jgi:hypothetical protein
MKFAAFLSIISALAILTLGPRAYTQSAQKLKTQEEIVREEMIDISKQLNVTCTECHKVDNFKDSSKATFKAAREHMKIVQVLKNNGFDGKQGPLATCYMCHRGELRPAYREGLKPVKSRLPAK